MDIDTTTHESNAIPPVPEVEVRLLPQQVAQHIRDLIIQDVLKPGNRIRERALAERLRVSRTPLREALRHLAADGLVRLLPNRGAVVAELSPSEVLEKLQVLGVLEELAGELACRNAGDAEIAEIRALHYEMLAAYARQDRLGYFKLNQQIHRHIVEATRNATLIEMHARLNAQLYRVRYKSNLRNTLWHTAIEEHEAILDALTKRDEKALGALLRSHLGSTWSKFSNLPDSAGETAKPAGKPGRKASEPNLERADDALP